MHFRSAQEQYVRSQASQSQGIAHQPIHLGHDFNQAAAPKQYSSEKEQEASGGTNNPPLRDSSNEPRISMGARVASTAQEAILAETLTIGATILRLKISYVMPCTHIAANGTMTVTWIRA